MTDKENKEYLNAIADEFDNRGLAIGDFLKATSTRNLSFLQPAEHAFKNFAQIFDQLIAGEYSKRLRENY